MSNSLKTLVVGASDNPERYAYKAVASLQKHSHEVEGVGLRAGNINGLAIHTDRPNFADIHTISLYVGAANQYAWIPYILSLKPKRIIFNPGTENVEFAQQAQEAGIETVEACTLVMLIIGTY